MTILLTILKVIGIIILSILGLILFILCLLLFVPIRYKLMFNKYGDFKDMEGTISVSWLLHIVYCSLKYFNKDIIIRFGIFGIKIKQISLFNKPENIIDKSNDKESSGSFNYDNSGKSNPNEQDFSEVFTNEHGAYKIETISDEEEVVIKTNNNPEIIDSEETIINDVKEHSSLKIKIKEFFSALYHGICNTLNKISDFWQNTEQKISEIENKISHIDKEINFYERFLNDERNKKAISNCFKQLKKILKSVRPRKVKGKILFGMEDPANTGQILSIISIIYPFLYKKIEIDTDFEKQILEGDLLIKGRITVIVLVITAWRVYFNRDLKRLLRIYKKHKNRDLNTKEDRK